LITTIYTDTNNYTLFHLRVPCFPDNISVVGNITDIVVALVCTTLRGLSPPIARVVCTVEGCIRGKGGQTWR